MNVKKWLFNLQLNLPHTRGKFCHKTAFFEHAILSKQSCLRSFCLFEGMHNILKYMQIYSLVTKQWLSWCSDPTYEKCLILPSLLYSV